MIIRNVVTHLLQLILYMKQNKSQFLQAAKKEFFLLKLLKLKRYLKSHIQGKKKKKNTKTRRQKVNKTGI